MDLESNRKKGFGKNLKNLGSVEPKHLATSFYLRSQGERYPLGYELKAREFSLNGVTGRYAVCNGSSVPLVALANRWGFVCSSRSLPVTAAKNPSRHHSM